MAARFCAMNAEAVLEALEKEARDSIWHYALHPETGLYVHDTISRMSFRYALPPFGAYTRQQALEAIQAWLELQEVPHGRTIQG